jgi:ribosomal-protein-alanine N-acetyltransferase
MLEQLLSQAEVHGVTHTLLEVREDNESALRLYGRMGFEQISRRPGYYADGTDALILRRPRGGA